MRAGAPVVPKLGPHPVEEGVHYAVFTGKGCGAISAGEAGPAARRASLDEALDALAGGAAGGPHVLLLGEVHDDAVAHALQMRVLRHCAEACKRTGTRLVLSLEMFERDVQRVLDEYVLSGAIREQDFLQDSRPWGTYASDYRPLVEFCRERGIRVVAANAPRRYVSLVSREGTAGLARLGSAAPSAARDALLPPLPLPPASAAYRQKFIETLASQMPPPAKAPAVPPSQPQAGAAEAEGEGCPFIGFRAEDVRSVRPEMLEAQLLWDHAMAMSIAESLECGGGDPTGGASSGGESAGGQPQPVLVIHVCGAFHCADGLGIPEALPLYAASSLGAGGGNEPWLPMDSALAGGTSPLDGQPDAQPGPKANPPGVTSLVCWPASVAGTIQAVDSGRVPRALGHMADWVVITDELFGE